MGGVFHFLIYSPKLSMKIPARAWRTRYVGLLARSRPSCLVGRHDGFSFTRVLSFDARPRHNNGRLPSRITKEGQHRSLTTLANPSDSTIYALSTAPGRGAIAIIRISGPACLSIYRSLCPGKKDPKPRYATVRTLYDPESPPTLSSVLDSGALVLYFPSPKTVTGEDLLELHVHGGTAIVRAVLAAIPRTLGSGSSTIHPLRRARRIHPPRLRQ
jgi:hypothetical protein